MSMAGGNPSLTLDFAVNTTMLDRALSDADRRITAATKSTGNTVDRLMDKVSSGISAKLGAAISSGLALKLIDDALRKVAQGLEQSQGVKEIGAAIGNGIVESIRAIPIAGGIMDITAQLGDLALGGPMARERASASAQAAMAQQNAMRSAAPGAFRELQMAGVSGAERDALEREMELARLTAIGERAKAGRTQMVDGVEMELEEGVLAAVQSAIEAGMKAFDDRRAARIAQELERVAKEKASAEESLRREEERAAAKAKADEERRLKEQEDAYDRFIEGNQREAIMALEAQIHEAGTAAAPSRGQRLADLMAGMGGGIATGDTALGAFTFATGDAAEISRGILEKATEQLAVLERIEDIQRRIAEMREGLN
jgi:hypothetical protein